MIRLLIIPLFALLAACGDATNTPAPNYRAELAKTELAATAAYQQVTALAKAGIIKKGSQTAVIIADAEMALAAAIRVWRTNPENPKFAEAGIAALPSLLQLIAIAKGQTAMLGEAGVRLCGSVLAPSYLPPVALEPLALAA